MAESLRDQLEANLDKIVTRDEDAIGSDAPASSPSGVIGSEPPQSKIAERPRDESGKFVEKKDAKAAPAEVPATPRPEKGAAPSSASAGAPVERKAPARPSSWKKDYWPHWDKLTKGEAMSAEEAAALAEYMGQREADFQHGVSAYKREWEQAKPVLEAMAPFMPLLQQHNISPNTWISNLGAAHRELALGTPQQKLARFGWLAQQYGVPIQALYDQAAQQQYLAAGGNGQNFQQQGMTQEQAIALFKQQFAQHASDQEVMKFASDQEKYPHMEALRETMAQLLESGLADDLPSAYEAAMKLPRHSDIWQSVQQQDEARREEERKAAEAQRVQKAKGKALSVRSATPTAPNEEKPRDRRSQLSETFDAVMGAGRV